MSCLSFVGVLYFQLLSSDLMAIFTKLDAMTKTLRKIVLFFRMGPGGMPMPPRPFMGPGMPPPVSTVPPMSVPSKPLFPSAVAVSSVLINKTPMNVFCC